MPKGEDGDSSMTTYLIIGAVAVGGLMLYKSGALTKAPVEMPGDTGKRPSSGGRKVVFNVEDAGRDYLTWVSKDYPGSYPPEHVLIEWFHNNIGFDEAPAYELEEWMMQRWQIRHEIGSREEWADEIRLIASQHGYTERT